MGEHFYTNNQFEKAGSAEGLAALFRIAVALYGHPFASDQDLAPRLGRAARPDGPAHDQAEAETASNLQKKADSREAADRQHGQPVASSTREGRLMSNRGNFRLGRP